MKFHEGRPYGAVQKRYIDITDGPVHPTGRGTTGRRFRVDLVTIEYLATDDGAWEVRLPCGPTLTGTVLKKDGSDSQLTHSGHPVIGGLHSNRRLTDEYQWLAGLIEAARPTGTVTLPRLPEGA